MPTDQPLATQYPAATGQAPGWEDTQFAIAEDIQVSAAGSAGTPGQGPFMVMVLVAQGGRVRDARFQTYGCPAAVACGEFAAGWAVGRTAEEAGGLSEADVLAGVGHMPLGREHCPGLAVRSLQQAVLELRAKVAG